MTQDTLVAGLDEVGRGPLVGSVVAAAVILGPDHGIEGLTDSKKLSEKRRQLLDQQIRERALCWSLAEASADEIDRINILQASMLAMQRAFDGLTTRPTRALVDGNRCPDVPVPCEAIVKGDATVAAISAASIIAKVYRDQQMLTLDRAHPEYGFAAHKGYPTAAHRDALARLGPLPEHRRSFAPVRRALAVAES
ncbi:MAG TPA: ribonuclease HII [Gammaproteobacteria bacterium]|jgi:ribonuclease HII|nr:ribonuclease HII [Gammaproteobacteria bacterium]